VAGGGPSGLPICGGGGPSATKRLLAATPGSLKALEGQHASRRNAAIVRQGASPAWTSPRLRSSGSGPDPAQRSTNSAAKRCQAVEAIGHVGAVDARMVMISRTFAVSMRLHLGWRRFWQWHCGDAATAGEPSGDVTAMTVQITALRGALPPGRWCHSCPLPSAAHIYLTIQSSPPENPSATQAADSPPALRLVGPAPSAESRAALDSTGTWPFTASRRHRTAHVPAI